MAVYDQDTQDFMAKFAEKEESDHNKHFKTVAKQSLGLAKDLAKGKRSVADTITRRVIKAGISALEKSGGISVMSIFDMLNNHYGSDWHAWAPETLWKTLNDEHMVTPTDEIKNLVGALQVLCKTDFVFEDFHVFEKIVHALNYHPVLFGVMQPAEPDAIALALKIIFSIRHRDVYEDDVLAYIAASGKHAGLVYLPSDLFPEGAQKFLDEMGNNIELRDKLLAHHIEDTLDEALQLQREKLIEIRDYSEV